MVIRGVMGCNVGSAALIHPMSGPVSPLGNTRAIVQQWTQLICNGVSAMLDRDGYRPNVAIVIVTGKNPVFWGKRIRGHSWQFPQGGINPGETPEQAMYRELREEVGLEARHVKV